MPLWDPNNVLSAEAPAMVALAGLLSKCTGFQRLMSRYWLANQTPLTEAAALSQAIVGPFDESNDPSGRGQRITLEQLVELGGFAQLLPADDEAHVAIEDDAAASCPDEGGTFEIWFRRPVSEAELAEGGKRDVYLFALDCISGIEYQLLELSFSENEPRIKSIRRTEGPMFAHVDEEGAEGMFLTAMLLVEWGFADEG